MLDINYIRQSPEEVAEMLRNRGQEKDRAKLDDLLENDRKRRQLVQQSDELKALRNKVSKDIAVIKRTGQGSAEDLILEMKEVADRIAGMDARLAELEQEMETILLALPNKLHPDVPVGSSANDNIQHKEAVHFDHPLDFPLQNHLDLGKKLDILDFERGAKITGTGFPVYKGKGAGLERALLNFMLDFHTEHHGYKEVFPPFLVNEASLLGVGQLPKFADQVYSMPEDGLYAIPTAEVPVTNLHRDEILKEKSLPLSYVAYSACFRREAGSYGKDTRGFLRVHQFNKVEMVQFTRPEESYATLEKILQHAEAILCALEIPYRVMLLCSEDISANAAKCYDIEVWAPAENRYLEASSCSNFEDFQARRANIRFKPEGSAKPAFVHTLNGSGLATSRLMVSLLENYQTAEGAVVVPEVLRKYTGFDTIG